MGKKRRMGEDAGCAKKVAGITPEVCIRRSAWGSESTSRILPFPGGICVHQTYQWGIDSGQLSQHHHVIEDYECQRVGVAGGTDMKGDDQLGHLRLWYLFIMPCSWQLQWNLPSGGQHDVLHAVQCGHLAHSQMSGASFLSQAQ